MTATLLIIEDNDDNLEIYRSYLTHAGYRVLCAEDGEEGLRSACEERPDLIVLDVRLPKMDGWEVARRLRADQDTRAIPILAVTACAMTGDEEKARELGLDGFHPKPIEPRRLAAEIARRLEPERT